MFFPLWSPLFLCLPVYVGSVAFDFSFELWRLSIFYTSFSTLGLVFPCSCTFSKWSWLGRLAGCRWILFTRGCSILTLTHSVDSRTASLRSRQVVLFFMGCHWCIRRVGSLVYPSIGNQILQGSSFGRTPNVFRGKGRQGHIGTIAGLAWCMSHLVLAFRQ